MFPDLEMNDLPAAYDIILFTAQSISRDDTKS